jgi:hypothetical protein
MECKKARGEFHSRRNIQYRGQLKRIHHRELNYSGLRNDRNIGNRRMGMENSNACRYRQVTGMKKVRYIQKIKRNT